MNKSISDRGMPTIYFPLTANPVGYHHLLLAENLLWQQPNTKLIVFVISNGHHPDPYKRKHIPNALLRLEILSSAIKDWANPNKSLPARIAAESGIVFKLKKNNCAISRCELSINRPVHFSENIQLFYRSKKTQIIVGADLIIRMLNPKIFSDQDLEIISRESFLNIAPRNQIEIEKILDQLKDKRGISFSYKLIQSKLLPQNLKKYFLISSSIIRKANEAGHDLETFLPNSAAKHILQNRLYIKKKLIFNNDISNSNELDLSCFELMEKLEESVKILFNLLNDLKIKKRPHKFSVIETSTGGKIADSFTNLSGASNHFIDGRILYSQESQEKFLSKSFIRESSVSKNMAINLANSMLKISGADWTLAETSVIGPPSNKRKSHKSGHCHLGLALKKETKYKFFEFNPFLTRKEHQLIIAIEGIKWAKNILQHLN